MNRYWTLINREASIIDAFYIDDKNWAVLYNCGGAIPYAVEAQRDGSAAVDYLDSSKAKCIRVYARFIEKVEAAG
jgi:hypothetical protein